MVYRTASSLLNIAYDEWPGSIWMGFGTLKVSGKGIFGAYGYPASSEAHVTK